MDVLRNQRGFSILELVIVSGIMSVVALGFIQVLTNQRKGIRVLEGKIERSQVARNLETILNDKNGCENTLSGLEILAVGTTTDVPSIKDRNDNIIYQSNGKSNQLMFSQIKVRNVDLAAPSSVGFVEIRVPTYINQEASQFHFQPYKALVMVSINAGRIVSSCIRSAFECVTARYAEPGAISGSGITQSTLNKNYPIASVVSTSTIMVSGKQAPELECINGWTMTGCSASTQGSSDSDNDEEMFKNSCRGDQDSDFNVAYIRCCRMISN